MKKAHLIDINNSFIFDLAIALKEKGYDVSASGEDVPDKRRKRLEETGIVCFSAWSPGSINNHIDFIVPATHIQPENPEIQRAKELNLQIMSIPEFVYDRTKTKTRVVVTGGNGKKELLSIIIHVLKKQKVAFDCVLNDPIPGLERIANLSYNARIAVIEGDELVSSFYRPHIALISYITWKKSKDFPEKNDYLKIFRDFIATIERDGKLIYNEQDEASNGLLPAIRDDITAIPYAIHPIIRENNETFLDTRFGKFPIRYTEKHFLENLNGARYVCRHLGIKDIDFYKAISEMSVNHKTK